MNFKFELIVLPVTDNDRAKEFYAEKMGWNVDVDHAAGDAFRVIQLTPPGSAASITFGTGVSDPSLAGTYKGMHLCVEDIAAARDELMGRGVAVSEPYHFTAGGKADGLHPTRARYGTYAEIVDPDGNQWILQEVNDNPTDAPPS